MVVVTQKEKNPVVVVTQNEKNPVVVRAQGPRPGTRTEGPGTRDQDPARKTNALRPRANDRCRVPLAETQGYLISVGSKPHNR